MRARRLLPPLLAAALASAAASADTFVYVHDRGDPNQVHAFSLGKDGDLEPVPGTPFAAPDLGGGCGGLCQTMAADKKTHRLFTSGAGGVSVWDVAEDGSLALVAGSPFGAEGLDGVAAVRVGKRLFVYATDFDMAQLRGFEAQPDGSLVELPSSPYPSGLGADGIAAVKRLVFAANEDEGTISSYVVGADGALAQAPGSPLAPDPEPQFFFNVTPSSTGKLLYVVDDAFDDAMDDANDVPIKVYAYGVDKKTAALTPVPGAPFDTTMPVADANQATGASSAKKLVVAVAFEAVNRDLQVFRIGKGGALEPLGGAQDSGLNALAHALDPKGRWLLVASDSNLRVSRIDGKSGVVTPVDQEPLGGGGATSNAVVLLSR